MNHNSRTNLSSAIITVANCTGHSSATDFLKCTITPERLVRSIWNQLHMATSKITKNHKWIITPERILAPRLLQLPIAPGIAPDRSQTISGTSSLWFFIEIDISGKQGAPRATIGWLLNLAIFSDFWPFSESSWASLDASKIFAYSPLHPPNRPWQPPIGFKSKFQTASEEIEL